MTGKPAEPFKDHAEVHEYAEANGLDYAWEGTKAFERRRQALSPEQFVICAVLTRKGVTNVGLFSKEIARAEWLADQPRRDRLAAGRVLQGRRRREQVALARWDLT